jgi:hypothetical protein
MTEPASAHTPPRQLWLDFKIPIWGLICVGGALLVQTGTLLIWGARMDERVRVVEAKVQAVSPAVTQISETVARMDERTKAMVVSVERIERRIDAAEQP